MSRTNRRYRKREGRKVWVFSDLNHDVAPEQIAKILTTAGLEQARREVEAQADDPTRHDRKDHPEVRLEGDHA